MSKLKVLDLFSGIAGFSIGLERTGGFETTAFCEIEEFPREVIRRHWPDVPCYDDVRNLNADALRRDGIAVDVICGGFPCQDISVSGSGDGLDGERSGLWKEFRRLIGELRPKFVIVENSPNLLIGERGAWFGTILSDLASLGYDAEWEVIPASAVGAPHRRERVWILAYPIGSGQPVERGLVNAVHQTPTAYREADHVVELFRRGAVPFVCGRHDGVSKGMDRLKSLGNAVVPQIPEMIGKAILEAVA